MLGSIAAGLVVAWMLKSEPNISGSGIPQVEGQLQGELEFHWWSILWKKFVAGIISIGPGLFLGREGPSIQLGAAVGQGVAQGFKKHGSDRRIMIAAGAAGGLAAAFNAPIAGTMFVLEEVYHNFSPLVWITSLASAVGANFISLNVFGEVPVLHLVYDRPLPVSLYWHLLLLGVLLGVLGFAYQKNVARDAQAVFLHAHSAGAAGAGAVSSGDSDWPAGSGHFRRWQRADHWV